MITEDLAQQFTAEACKYLEKEFLPKIKKCVGSLADEEIWWRPNERSNSVGNMLLHLRGNVRQWIIAGVGQTEDTRIRDLEFREQGPISKSDLLEKLESTIQEAVEVIKRLEPGELMTERHIQVYDVTILQAIFHVVEHFSGHTGQIIYVTKMLKNKDCRFYDL